MARKKKYLKKSKGMPTVLALFMIAVVAAAAASGVRSHYRKAVDKVERQDRRSVSFPVIVARDDGSAECSH